jgi:hypothetical protein
LGVSEKSTDIASRASIPFQKVLGGVINEYCWAA